VRPAGAYVPDRGDVVWISLDPRSGHEQAGRRPALVLSPVAYNRKVGLALFCPITGQVKGFPFEVPLPAGLAVTGVILSDQVKSLYWRACQAERIAHPGGDHPGGARSAQDPHAGHRSLNAAGFVARARPDRGLPDRVGLRRPGGEILGPTGGGGRGTRAGRSGRRRLLGGGGSGRRSPGSERPFLAVPAAFFPRKTETHQISKKIFC
jgi:mRNA interferase MazF